MLIKTESMDNENASNNAEKMISFLNALDTDVKYFIEDYYDNAFKIDLKNNIIIAKNKKGKAFTIAKESEKYRLSIIPINEVKKQDFEQY